jgi:hypothetical protein
MRWCLRTLFIALIVVGFCAPLQSSAKIKPDKGLVPETCTGDYGTSVHFEKNPKEAAKKALKEEKLVLVIHISGHFEEPDYT